MTTLPPAPACADEWTITPNTITPYLPLPADPSGGYRGHDNPDGVDPLGEGVEHSHECGYYREDAK